MLFKFYMTDESKILPNGIKVYRIIAARSFGHIRKGDIGGWLQYAENLSQLGESWVADNAIICGESVVSQDAMVKDNAVIDGHCRVFGNAFICDQAILRGRVYVYDHAIVGEESSLAEECSISGKATVFCTSRWTNSQSNFATHICGSATVKGNATICGKASIRDKALIEEDATVSESGRVYEEGHVSGHAVVRGQSSVCDRAWLMDNAVLLNRAKVAGGVRLGGKMILSGRTFMTGWGTCFGKTEYHDKIISGDGALIYDRFPKKEEEANVS